MTSPREAQTRLSEIPIPFLFTHGYDRITILVIESGQNRIILYSVQQYIGMELSPRLLVRSWLKLARSFMAPGVLVHNA